MWFGAHMDAHTFETSVSQAPHGMSFASLIGQGCPEWVKLGGVGGKVAPHQAVQIGVRSFEAAEAALLKSHHVTVFSQEQINTFGLKSIFQSAYDQIVQTTPWFGVSLDINVFDPTQAPGTGTPEPNGVDYRSFLPLVKGLAYQEHCLAFEIAEFNPDKDQEDKTLNLILQLVQTVLTP